MKKLCLLIAVLGCGTNGFGQSTAPDSTNTDRSSVAADAPHPFLDWIAGNVKIGQSMETADKRAEPAQFQFTLPKNDTASYLINLGMSVNLDFLNSGGKLLSKVKAEYHKNTLTEKKQENIEFGYQGTWNFVSIDKTLLFLTFDPKYNYDGISYKNSLASNVLFSWFTDDSKFNWNTNNYNSSKTFSHFWSVYAGTQLQEVFKTKEGIGEGFILRPMYSVATALSWNREGKTKSPILQLSTTYTGRFDAINKTVAAGDKEGYTHLLKCGLDWFVVSKPAKVSFGVSYNLGSDPLKGLADQRFWLFTVNVAI